MPSGTNRAVGRTSFLNVEHMLTERSGERALASCARRQVEQISAGGIRWSSAWWLECLWSSGSLRSLSLLVSSLSSSSAVLESFCHCPASGASAYFGRQHFFQEFVFPELPGLSQYVLKLFFRKKSDSRVRHRPSGLGRTRAGKSAKRDAEPENQVVCCCFPSVKTLSGAPEPRCGEEPEKSSPDTTEAVLCGTRESLRKGRFLRSILPE